MSEKLKLPEMTCEDWLDELEWNAQDLVELVYTLECTASPFGRALAAQYPAPVMRMFRRQLRTNLRDRTRELQFAVCHLRKKAVR